ncbi:phosphopantetheine-binding protein, partial [Massilia aurea]|uniref:phosphopantetheine-binding protein n=1 Tax=Massilia aurea TaxID=373040 RepID=UPI00361BDDE3
LGLERVGRNDHFFELGGHSLLVITMTERLRKKGLGADVRVIFTEPTLAAFAARLERSGSSLPTSVDSSAFDDGLAHVLPPLVTLGLEQRDAIAAKVPGGASAIQDIYPLGPLQEGILFHHLLDNETDTYLLRTAL